MSATARHPFGSPFGSSTKGIGMDDLNRGRSEFEARIERATGKTVDGYRFDAEFTDRWGNLDITPVRARNIEEATAAAIRSARPTGRRFDRVYPDWSHISFTDGTDMERRDALALVEKTKEAV
jgi:hypothetical protein